MKNNKPKIFFIVPSLAPGGAERIMVFLTKNINLSEFNCTLIVLSSNENIAYDIKDINIDFLNKKRVLFAIPNLIQYIYKKKPQIVMSTIVHLNITMGFISILFPKIIFVGRQASIIKISAIYSDKKQNPLLKILSKRGLHKLDHIICQSSDMYKDCMEEYEIDEKKLHILHNPITDGFNLKPNYNTKNNKIIKFITVGRLVKVKGFNRILNVLSQLQIPFHYTIIGDGPEKNNIIDQINLLNLNDKVELIRFSNNIAEYLVQNDFYLQGSFAEGFPNALLESCAVGTPVIAFSAPGGTRDIIENGVNGFIVNDEQDFIHHLKNLKHFDPENVAKSVQEKFGKKIILHRYEEFFKNILYK